MGGPIPFPGNNNNIPIVGEPCSVDSWTGTFLVICKNCTPHRPVLVPGLAPLIGLCPGCRRGFQILGVQYNAPSNRPADFQINIVLPPGDAAGEGMVKPS